MTTEPLNIYVASSWRNDFQPGVVAALRSDGHRVYDFKGPGAGWGNDGDGPGGFSWSEVDPDWKSWPEDVSRFIDGLNHPRAVEGFNRDMDALLQCDVCVMVMPCGPSASMEMGWAAGAGKYVAIYVPGMREPDLMVKMADYIGSDLEAIRAQIVALSVDPRSTEQRYIGEWYRENGGHATPINAAKRMQKELKELIDALEIGDIEGAKEELADVAICGDIVAEALAFCRLRKVYWKMRINEAREWEVDAEGCLSHVRGTDPREVCA